MALCRFNVAKYRIVRRNSFVDAGMPIYEVEERRLLWWEHRGILTSFDEAQRRIASLKATVPVKKQVVAEYD